jgi:uncharacterized membrane protein AbrB (regulator of aidB expression)
MVQFAITNLLFGAVFGLRFRVLVLLPLTIASGLTTVAFALFARQSLPECLEIFVACALALHAGYLFGSMTRFTLAAARSAHVPARHKTASEIHS